MSKLTEILKLFCYDPETDGANTFNIPKALNENWEKIDQLVLLAVAAAAAYDPEGSYAVGAYCTHSGKLHKCGTAIPDGEAWNAAHWTETTVAAELADVRASLSNKVPQMLDFPNADLNDVCPSTRAVEFAHTFNPIGNRPNGYSVDSDFALLSMSTNLSARWINQLLFDVRRPAMFLRCKLDNQWDKWVPIATATPPEEHAIVPKNGATLIDGFKNSYSKDQFGRVFVYFSLRFENVPERNREIFSLPQSFAPTGGTVVGAAGLSMASQFPAFVVAYENGVVTVEHYITEYSGTINLHGFLVIDTGGTQ